MRSFWSVVLIFCCFTFFSAGDVFAEKPEKVQAVKRLNHSGDVVGTVTCDDTSVSVDGTLVYIPGLSIMAKTDETGDFRLLNVPKGEEVDIVIEVPEQVATIVEDVEVKKKRVTNLEVIEVTCVSAAP